MTGATRRRLGRRRASPGLVATRAILPQRVLPLTDLLTVQAVEVAGIGGGLLIDRPGWRAVAAGFVVALLCVVPIRGRSMPRWAAERLGFVFDRWRRKRRRGPSEPFDAKASDGTQIGFQWDGKTLLSLLRIDQNPQAITVMEPALTVAGESVAMEVLADCLRQFDIRLDSIDVICRGVRSHGNGHVGAVYDAVLGPLPAVAERAAWVVVRMNPTGCPDAVRRRGSGRDAIMRTAATATRRVANRLSDAGVRAHIMTAAEMTRAVTELSDGLDVTDIGESWLACHAGRFELRSFSITPALFTTGGLESLWTVPSHSTTLCVTLRRNERDDVLQLRGLVRFGVQGRVRVDLPGLEQLPGRQYAALLCSLPVPPPRRSVQRWVVGRGATALHGLTLPTSGCGQLVGADEHGRAVALPLFGPRVQRVEMCGTLHLAQQVVLRSLALGAGVRVRTSRPAAWQVMADQVGDRHLLRVNDSGNGAVAAPADPSRPFAVEMFDGPSERTVPDGVTTMVVRPVHAEPSRRADVTLQLLDHDHDLVRVATRTESAVVTMVATDDEMRYLKSSLDA